jgi:hypothetical protein
MHNDTPKELFEIGADRDQETPSSTESAGITLPLDYDAALDHE